MHTWNMNYSQIMNKCPEKNALFFVISLYKCFYFCFNFYVLLNMPVQTTKSMKYTVGTFIKLSKICLDHTHTHTNVDIRRVSVKCIDLIMLVLKPELYILGLFSVAFWQNLSKVALSRPYCMPAFARVSRHWGDIEPLFSSRTVYLF